MLIRHDHHMAGGVGIGVQADKAVRAAMDDMGGLLGGLAGHAVGDGVVDGARSCCRRRSACPQPQTAASVQAPAGTPVRACRVASGNVAVAPRRPEAIHSREYSGADCSRPGCVGEVNYFRVTIRGRSLHPMLRSKDSSVGDDVAMKMHAPGLAFVDGRLAKFYALSEPLRVGPKCNRSSARPDSLPILPKLLRG